MKAAKQITLTMIVFTGFASSALALDVGLSGGAEGNNASVSVSNEGQDVGVNAGVGSSTGATGGLGVSISGNGVGGGSGSGGTGGSGSGSGGTGSSNGGSGGTGGGANGSGSGSGGSGTGGSGSGGAGNGGSGNSGGTGASGNGAASPGSNSGPQAGNTDGRGAGGPNQRSPADANRVTRRSSSFATQMITQALGTTVWSSDRDFIGEIASAKPGPDGYLDVSIRLSRKVGNGRIARLRLNPEWIRNGQFKMRLSTAAFINRMRR